ncbi:MAG: DUF4097 family beta strand repeat-containing protein [Flavobacteriaceae bacterium]|uniref:DUF4097 family beta strand repeat-containing protein n=1 Tax=Flagellimonas sp. SN16 TaxID=3415142 RepID=UPI00260147E4|nr:DUF4097 family beta strand repeat-containing protein [Allomuricauda sp.]MCR9265503.1 DUF4097 family beta strand repeat-containing protein [Flavobacteriaceae bacterium]
MKKMTLLFTALVLSALTHAQNDYTKSLNGIEWVKIESKADITVRTYTSNEILIKAGDRHQVSERAKGLRLVGEGGNDNTEVGFYVVQDGNTLIVKNLRKSEGAEIFLPKNQNVAVKSTWNGNIEIDGFAGEIEADAQLNGSIEILDVNGPVTANTLNGEVTVEFGTVKQNSPISIYSTNGAVDVTLPGNTPADLSLSSVNGDIYTNFDLKREEKDGLKSVSGRKLNAAINNGGVSISLKSTNGNIYLRKQ